MISIVIPSHNNLRHLKNAYESIKKHAPQAEIILYDDASTDGTWGWMLKIATVDRNCKILMRIQDKDHPLTTKAFSALVYPKLLQKVSLRTLFLQLLALQQEVGN